MLRKCRVCSLEAEDEGELVLFYKDKTCKYDRDNICKPCANIQRAKANILRQERYQWEAIQSLGGSCEGCGKVVTKDTMVCFDFHHTQDNKREGELTMSHIIQRNSLSIILKEATKCILFCACCHRLHHKKYGY